MFLYHFPDHVCYFVFRLHLGISDSLSFWLQWWRLPSNRSWNLGISVAWPTAWETQGDWEAEFKFFCTGFDVSTRMSSITCKLPCLPFIGRWSWICGYGCTLSGEYSQTEFASVISLCGSSYFRGLRAGLYFKVWHISDVFEQKKPIMYPVFKNLKLIFIWCCSVRLWPLLRGSDAQCSV